METVRECYVRRKSADSAPKQLCLSPIQIMSSSLKKTSSSQGSGMTIPSSQAVSTQPSSSCPHTSTTSSGSLPSTRSAAATRASPPSATEPVGRVSTRGPAAAALEPGTPNSRGGPRHSATKFGQRNATSPRLGFLISETQNNKNTRRHGAVVRIALENAVWVLTVMPSV